MGVLHQGSVSETLHCVIESGVELKTVSCCDVAKANVGGLIRSQHRKLNVLREGARASRHGRLELPLRGKREDRRW